MPKQELNKKLAERELARKLLDWAGLLELRTVILTGREDEEYQRQAFFFKPFGDRLVTQCWQDKEGKWHWQDGWYLGFGWLVQSLDACFKWLVPKVLEEVGKYETVRLVNNAVCDAVESKSEIALALCKAIEKLIDAEKE